MSAHTNSIWRNKLVLYIYSPSKTYLRPKPKAYGTVSPLRVPSSLKNRSGLNVSGSGYVSSSRIIALKRSFMKGGQRENCYIYHMFGITIVPAESVTRERLFMNDVDLPLGK